MPNPVREEITRRGWWVLKHHGYEQRDSGDLSREAIVGEFLFRRFETSGENKSPSFLVYRTRNRDGMLQVEFDTVAHRGRNPNYDEWQRIINALRRKMLLKDLADA